MRSALLYLFIFISSLGFSQEQSGIIVGITKSGLANPVSMLSGYFKYADDEPIAYNQYGFSLGYRFSTKLNSSLEVGMINFNQERDMKTVQMGLNLSYRFLNKSTISPKIAVRGGTFLYSNSQDLWKAYGNADFLASFLYDRIEVDIGFNLNYLYRDYIDINNYNNYSEIINRHGIGLGYTFNIRYTFPFNTQN